MCLNIALQPCVLIIFNFPPMACLHFRGGTPSKRMSVQSILGWDGQTGHLETISTLLPTLLNILNMSQLRL